MDRINQWNCFIDLFDLLPSQSADVDKQAYLQKNNAVKTIELFGVVLRPLQCKCFNGFI